MGKIYGWILIFFIMTLFPVSFARADGGYFVSSRSVAVSADQRAIIIKNGKEISMTFSTGYTGEGEDFGWIIPTPVPPEVEDVSEAETGEEAFEILDEYTAPTVVTLGGGCFVSGTAVLTASGPRAIEEITQGTEVYACDIMAGEWITSRVNCLLSYRYEGDMITIQMGDIKVQATGNHPFFVLKGDRLASRPPPRDVPQDERGMNQIGRWVEARDLRAGDVIKDKSGEGLMITGISSRHENTEVYNLDVEGYNNYAVHQKGILAHNKMGKGGEVESESASLVTVYGRVTLEHYEVSVLGAADSSALLNWLQAHGYSVNPAARDVLDAYIDREWSFVAVKLNPGEKRIYENEFLPPLAIKYRHDELIYPLHISSVSTTRTVKITLYVIAESTVTSSNFTTKPLYYSHHVANNANPEKYVDSCIRRAIGSMGGLGLVVMWCGELDIGDHEQVTVRKIRDDLMKTPFAEGTEVYLTRLETRMDPAAMTEDIKLLLDLQPNRFDVHIEADAGYASASDLISAVRDGKPLAIQEMFFYGFDANAKDGGGRTALMMAADRGRTEIARLLLNEGADADAKDLWGRTALMSAIWSGETDAVKLLLDAGADVNTKNNDGRTALMYAATRSRSETVQLLLDAGADLNAKDKRGWTALKYADDRRRFYILNLLRKAGAME